MPCDIDAILELGDHIYIASFQEVIQKGPRMHTFLAAAEVKGKIFVNVERLNRGVVTVQCKAMVEKEMPGVFGRDAASRIHLFFKNFTYGVFICSSLAVALYKQDDLYVLFDPHERTAGGKMESGGFANIFFFLSANSLFQFLCNFGYHPLREFTLTPFSVLEVPSNQPGNVPAPLNRRLQMIEIDDVSDDDIPIVKSAEWDAEDEVPLSRLVKKRNQVSSAKSAKSAKVVNEQNQVNKKK